jgi:hypothetical protein
MPWNLNVVLTLVEACLSEEIRAITGRRGFPTCESAFMSYPSSADSLSIGFEKAI